jgi:hypothetical protein
VQFFGTADNYILDPSNKGPEGSRKDPNAINIELSTYEKLGNAEMKKTIAAPLIYVAEIISNIVKWSVNQGVGHSTQQQEKSQDQIVNETQKEFKGKTR